MKEEVLKCVELLHSDYKTNNIHIFNTYSEFIKWSIKNRFFDFIQFKKVFKKQTLGCYFSNTNQIQLYIFNHSIQQRYLKQCVIFSLFHELRHYYQHKNNTRVWTINNQFDITDEKYRTSPAEKDANKFAARMMTKYEDEISRILNVYPDWEVLRDY